MRTAPRSEERVEGLIDGTVQDSFPASDPPSQAGLRLGRPRRTAAPDAPPGRGPR